MRRVAIAFVSAALLGGVIFTNVASADHGGEELHYLARATSFEKSDLGDGGKQVVVNFDLYEHDHDGDAETQGYTPQDHPGKEKAGHGVATCVTADMAEGILCTGNIMVADGQISSQGIIHMHSRPAADDGSHHAMGQGAESGGKHSVRLPITGGSGGFIGAAGEVEISHAGGHAKGGSHMQALGMAPDNQGADHGGGGHHGLHLTFHLQ